MKNSAKLIFPEKLSDFYSIIDGTFLQKKEKISVDEFHNENS